MLGKCLKWRMIVMKKKIIAIAICVSMILPVCLGGCKGSYDYEKHLQEADIMEDEQPAGMAEDLAVISLEDGNRYNCDNEDGADLVINDTLNEVVAAHNCFDKRYPASITKIMTALLVLENCDLSDTITLDHDVVMMEEGAVASNLTKGDTVTIEQVLKTMLIMSANDCSVILAEYVSGSEQAFAEKMTSRAYQLGATHTQFKNSNGLHVDDHYTTAYDLYLIFKEVVKYDEFVDIVSTSEYVLEYTGSNGEMKRQYVQTTNHYLSGENAVPDGVIMYGGKTGTTSMAGSCLIVMTENSMGERYFSVVLGTMSKDQLYSSMSQLLEKTVK